MKTVTTLPALLNHLPMPRPRRAISIMSAINTTDAATSAGRLVAIQAARGAA